MADHNYDIVIIGASFCGVAAALAAAAERNVRVVLLEATDWVGGQATAQGVTRWDEASVELLATTCGTKSYRNLRHAIGQFYHDNATLSAYGKSQTNFNPGFAQTNFPLSVDPSVTSRVLHTLVDALSGWLDLRLNTSIASVDAANGSVQRVTTTSGDTYTAKVFLDATDLGDLLPLAGLPWKIGAEAHADTLEPAAPAVEHREWIQPITVPIAIERRDGENHTIAKPANYDEIARTQRFHVVDGDINGVLRPLPPAGQESVFGYRQYIDARNFADPDYAHDRTTLNVGSNDYMAATLPSGDPARDRQIYEGARDASIAFLYWLQTDAPRDGEDGTGFPELAVRTDAFGTQDGCAPQAYIRESRRIDAEERVLQQDIAKAGFPQGTPRARLFPKSCGIGTYGIDIHAASGPGTPWLAFETLPFQIPLGALLPKQLDNFVAACKNIGATHLTSGAYRVHPVEWAIGEAAGVLAAFAVRQNVTPKDVWRQDDRCTTYQYRLLARGIPIYWWSDLQFEDDSRAFAAAHHCAVKGVFSGGEGGLGFNPSGPANEATCKAIEDNLGQKIDWPNSPITRADAAILVCQKMGWPIG
jgi:glycine/D-amino acid oxidase-like deaminating enzyme